MSKLVTIFTLSLLLCFGLIYASRPNVEFDDAISSLHEDVEPYKAAKAELDEESCEGVDGREECLMRRTLAAHVDYIYTQKHKPRNRRRRSLLESHHMHTGRGPRQQIQ